MKWSGFKKLLLWKITMFNNIYIKLIRRILSRPAFCLTY